jgi:hypothetical protein
LKSAIFVFEHPTGEQRKWQLQNPNCEIDVNDEFLWFGEGLLIGTDWKRADFGMTELDAGFISLQPAGNDGWSAARMLRMEPWGV